MSRREQLHTLYIAAHTLNFDIHLVDGMVGTYTCLNRQRAELIVEHKVCRVNLSAIEEGGVEVILPYIVVLVTVPILNIIITVLAV